MRPVRLGACAETGERGADTVAGDGHPRLGKPHLHTEQGASQRKVIEVPEVADAEYPSGQAAEPGAERHVVAVKYQLAHEVRIVPVRNHYGSNGARVVVRLLAQDFQTPPADRPAGRLPVPGVPGENGTAFLLSRHCP